MKITVAGIGYVGLSNAVLLAQRHDVTAFDISPERVAQITAGTSPIIDADIEARLARDDLRLTATTDKATAFADPDYILVATPTNYDPETNFFDTSSVEAVVADAVAMAPEAIIIVKSTVPLGFTDRICAEMGTDKVIFSPEFLREGQALHDNLYPSRIVVGEKSGRARVFAEMLAECAEKTDVPILLTGSGALGDGPPVGDPGALAFLSAAAVAWLGVWGTEALVLHKIMQRRRSTWRWDGYDLAVLGAAHLLFFLVAAFLVR